jgi:glycosyltransferase involved in cell wall biosynthesis
MTADTPLPLPRVLYLTGQRDACAYWRVLAPATALVARGYPVRVFDTFDDRAAAVARQVDVLILPRHGWEPADWLAGLRWFADRRREGLTILYETDDDVFSEAWVTQGQAVRPDRPRALLAQDGVQRIKALQQCDGVIVSTPRLATLVRTYTRAPVVVVPNAIDWATWRATCVQGLPPWGADPRQVVIGWAGGKRDEGDLRPVAEAWARIARRYPATRFVVAGWPAPCLTGAVPSDRLRCAAWLPIDVYPTAYKGWDIGCAPLEDKAFNFYKSPIKCYEAAAAGAAVVASPVVYGSVIRHGRHGLLARTAAEWEAALARFVTDPRFRRGCAARLAARVERRYSLAANLSRWPASWAYLHAQARARQAAS